MSAPITIDYAPTSPDTRPMIGYRALCASENVLHPLPSLPDSLKTLRCVGNGYETFNFSCFQDTRTPEQKRLDVEIDRLKAAKDEEDRRVYAEQQRLYEKEEAKKRAERDAEAQRQAEIEAKLEAEREVERERLREIYEEEQRLRDIEMMKRRVAEEERQRVLTERENSFAPTRDPLLDRMMVKINDMALVIRELNEDLTAARSTIEAVQNDLASTRQTLEEVQDELKSTKRLVGELNDTGSGGW